MFNSTSKYRINIFVNHLGKSVIFSLNVQYTSQGIGLRARAHLCKSVILSHDVHSYSTHQKDKELKACAHLCKSVVLSRDVQYCTHQKEKDWKRMPTSANQLYFLVTYNTVQYTPEGKRRTKASLMCLIGLSEEKKIFRGMAHFFVWLLCALTLNQIPIEAIFIQFSPCKLLKYLIWSSIKNRCCGAKAAR